MSLGGGSDDEDGAEADDDDVFEGDAAALDFLAHVEVACRNLIVDGDFAGGDALALGDGEGDALPQAEVEAYLAAEAVIA